MFDQFYGHSHYSYVIVAPIAFDEVETQCLHLHCNMYLNLYMCTYIHELFSIVNSSLFYSFYRVEKYSS